MSIPCRRSLIAALQGATQDEDPPSHPPELGHQSTCAWGPGGDRGRLGTRVRPDAGPGPDQHPGQQSGSQNRCPPSWGTCDFPACVPEQTQVPKATQAAPAPAGGWPRRRRSLFRPAVTGPSTPSSRELEAISASAVNISNAFTCKGSSPGKSMVFSM